jgi:hypothetical protein
MRWIEYHAIRTYGGMHMYIQALLLVSPDRVEQSAWRPSRYSLVKYALGTHWILGKPQIGMDVVAKKISLSLSGIEYSYMVYINC